MDLLTKDFIDKTSDMTPAEREEFEAFLRRSIEEMERVLDDDE